MQPARYSRNISFAPIGSSGQKRLSSSTVAVVGLGGIGSLVSSYLARSGVNLVLIDKDSVDASNLQRQLLYSNSDASSSVPKVKAAQKALSSANPNIRITSFQERLSPSNIKPLLSGADLVLDATDNLNTRFVLNDFCVKNKLPWVFCAAEGDRGMSMTFVPGSACFACFMPSGPVPVSGSDGLLAPAAAISASIGASEAIKYISKAGSPNSSLLSFSLLDLSFTISKISKNRSCKTCSKKI